MADGTTREVPLSEADKAHRFGRWVGVPLLVFIGASVLATLWVVVNLFIFIFSVCFTWAG